jgi:8-oxo-dGTP pyrophosphatase MutT (NUDIX family)
MGARRSSLEFPVSVKGVVLYRGRAVSLRNERAEWELPGVWLEDGETLRECVAREVFEELNREARALVLDYGCFVERFDGMTWSAEHLEAGFFRIDELDGISSPEGYARAVRAWVRHPAVSGP